MLGLNPGPYTCGMYTLTAELNLQPKNLTLLYFRYCPQERMIKTKVIYSFKAAYKLPEYILERFCNFSPNGVPRVLLPDYFLKFFHFFPSGCIYENTIFFVCSKLMGKNK